MMWSAELLRHIFLAKMFSFLFFSFFQTDLLIFCFAFFFTGSVVFFFYFTDIALIQCVWITDADVGTVR